MKVRFTALQHRLYFLPGRSVAVLTAALAIASCGGENQNVPLPPSTVVVDTTLVAARGSLPGMTAMAPARPTAIAVDDHGHAAEFVANEVIVVASERPAVDAFAARWGGVIEGVYDLAALGDNRAVYLVQVDPALADVNRLAQDLAAISPQTRADVRVSSDAGMRTLAVAAQASSDGVITGLNWLAAGASFVDRMITEGPMGPGAYSPNPFNWDHLRAGGPLDIGVTEAWRALEFAGRLSSKVRVGVMDGGFNWAGNADMPAGGIAGSVVPGGAPAEVTNDMRCGSMSCPWHGTSVSQVLAGVVNNGVGTAGVAGPVGSLVTIRTWGDFFTMIGGVILAGTQGVRVLNMSLTTPVPFLGAGFVVPFEITTAIARASGMLLFAAAGNTAEDVDEKHCFGVCWEPVWFTPCENAGVECIGAIGPDRQREPRSSFGAKQVLTYAPWGVFAGPNPDSPTSRAILFGGTSAASPYAAGVAALIWAADPALTANQVMQILRSSADPFTVTGGDTRIVNARAAVAMALGNVPPLVTIVAPQNDVHLPYGAMFDLQAQVDDLEDGAAGVTVQWSSDLDGALGVGTAITTDLRKGTHTITATATDKQGATSKASIIIHADNVAPVASMAAPAPGTKITQNVPFTLQGSAFDANLGLLGSLPCSSLQWSSPSYPGWSATGCAVTRPFSGLGPLTIVLTATDLDGAVGSTSRTVSVVAPPLNAPPDVYFLSPNDGEVLDSDVSAFLNGGAIDPDGGAITSYRWTVIRDGVETEIHAPSANPSFNWTPSANLPFHCGGYPVTLRLYATDSQGQTGVSEINIYVFFPTC